MESKGIFLCTIIFLSVVTVKYSYAKLPYGSPCTNEIQCQGIVSQYDVKYSDCKNGRCNCSFSQRLQFTNNNYECQHILYGDTVTCEPDDNSTCINGVCKNEILSSNCICNDGFIMSGKTCREILSVDYEEDCKTPDSGPVPVCDYDRVMHCKSGGKCDCFSGYFYDKVNKTCISSEEYVKNYPEETIANLNEACGSSIGGLPKLCEEEANLFCKDKKCLCTKEFYPVESNNTCESKKSFMEAHNLTVYKVMPGEYCYDDSDCITGLDCHSKKCACPYPCTFANKISSCDCGEVSTLEGASPAILIGVIGGLIIIFFWSYMIRKTMHKGQNKPSMVTNVRMDENGDSPPLSRPVPLNEPYRIKSTSMGTYSTQTSNPPPASSTVPPYPIAPVGFTSPPTSSVPPPYQQDPNYTSPVTDVAHSTTTAYPPSSVPGYAAETVDPTVGAPTYPSGDSAAPPPYTPYTQTESSAPPAVDIYKPII